MKIGILQCGAAPAPLEALHGSYGSMMRRLLPPGHATQLHDVTMGDLPGDATDCAAWLITGSPAGVYDDLPWIAPLLGFLRAARGRAKLVGVCFGHQAMAEAFGGRVVKSPKGWGIGLHRYDVPEGAEWMVDAAPVGVPASHQDQVVEQPPGARVMLHSDFTPLAGLDYGDAISFQCHPEFTRDFAVDLIEARREVFGAMTDPAIASLTAPADSARMAEWIGAFLR